MTLNQKEMTLELTRIQVCDLILACTYVDHNTIEECKKWNKLHDELEAQLRRFDKEQEDR